MYNYYFLQETPSSHDWVAISALLVAIVSLIATIIISRRTLTLTKKHNKKTVEPFLTGQYLNMSEEKNPDLRYQSYSLKNCGPGPAIITSLVYTYNGQQFTNIEPFLWEHLTGFEESNLSFFKIGQSHILSSNEDIELFKVSCRDQNNLKRLLEVSNKLGIQVSYESIYGIKKSFERGPIFKG